MAGLTQADAEAMLATWLAAEAKVAANQEYTVGTRTYKRADLAAVSERVKYWQDQVNRLANGGGMRARGLTAG